MSTTHLIMCILCRDISPSQKNEWAYPLLHLFHQRVVLHKDMTQSMNITSGPWDIAIFNVVNMWRRNPNAYDHLSISGETDERGSPALLQIVRDNDKFILYGFCHGQDTYFITGRRVYLDKVDPIALYDMVPFKIYDVMLG